VHEREVWVVDFLKRSTGGGETVRSVWEAAQRLETDGGLGDTVSLPNYHRTIAKLVRRGQVEEAAAAPDGSSRYAATEQLSPLNTFTLSDLSDALWELSAPEAFALYIEAVDYYESRSELVLGKAATALMQEEPCALILAYLKDCVEHLQDDVEDLLDGSTIEQERWHRVERQLKALRHFVQGELGVTGKVWILPSMEDVAAGVTIEPRSWDEVAEELAGHVFGAAFVERVTATSAVGISRLIVAGTDGSSHAGFVRGVPAPAFAEEEGRLMLTFNNSIAYVDIPEGHPQRSQFPYHGVPMTRSALEDPHNKGMVISRPWFDTLTDSEFEHMKKAALDVVQFRVDERLITGTARAYGTNPVAGASGLLPKPHVLIRDGTVTPQERELQHYAKVGPDGDVVREGIALSHNILKAVKDSERRVFAGAVKSTQLRTFSRIINWYIKRGSARQLGKAIDPTWDMARASHVADAVAVTRLLGSLPRAQARNEYYRTCIFVRPFPAMVTSLRGRQLETPKEWLNWFQERQRAEVEEWRKSGGPQSVFTSADLQDDPYVRMCQEADYAMFYFGQPGGDPQVGWPRFEFLDALRGLAPGARESRVLTATQMIVDGVHATQWTLDRDHNYLSRFKLPRLIPYVVYEAHEKCKVLGHKLEAELRQAIAANLAQLKALRAFPGPKVDIEPISLTGYLARAAKRLFPARGAPAEGFPVALAPADDVVDPPPEV
jgi:hypothetical protein